MSVADELAKILDGTKTCDVCSAKLRLSSWGLSVGLLPRIGDGDYQIAVDFGDLCTDCVDAALLALVDRRGEPLSGKVRKAKAS